MGAELESFCLIHVTVADCWPCALEMFPLPLIQKAFVFLFGGIFTNMSSIDFQV